MPKLTEENKQELNEKLKYIGIDLNDIPDIIKNAEPLEFIATKAFSDKEHRVYKHIPVNQIQVLVTPKGRGAEFGEKYKEASPIYNYLEPKEDESIEKYSMLLNMLSLCSKEGIEEIEKEQNLLIDSVPFDVKYKGSYIWEIYYSDYADKYFMLVSSDSQEYNELFYLLKKQIEYHSGKSTNIPSIFVPVNLLNYSEDILTRQEILDIQNYLWLFTNDWASIYEVFNREGEPNIYIIGDTNVYKKIKSRYRIVLKAREEASKFFKMIKALFILQSEFTKYYKFATQINQNGELVLCNSKNTNTEITYESLSDFIRQEYTDLLEKVKRQDKEIIGLQIELKRLKKEIVKRELEYIQKQKEISTYLEYKRTFFGRVKYFFKKRTPKFEQTQKEEEVQEESKVNVSAIELLEKEKNLYNLYTIENLLTVFNLYKQQLNYIKNMHLDINSLKLKIQNIDTKIKNATTYINEIDKHKKSIFEFWKFAGKDEVRTLNAGADIDKPAQEKVKAVFDYETDIEDLGIKMDRLQRKKLSTDELNSIFLASTNVLHTINLFKEDKYVSIDLQNLKEELESTKEPEEIENYDIFGVILSDRTKIRKLGNKAHREAEREKFRILNLKRDTDIFEFKNNISKALNMLNESFNKITNPIDLDLYVLSDGDFDTDKYYQCELNEENALNGIGEGNYNLYKIKVTEGFPLIFFTNVIYYDNKNGTLPEGMNVKTRSLNRQLKI